MDERSTATRNGLGTIHYASMKKKDLREVASISTASMAKLGKNENVNTDILIKVCKALNCDISDIMEIEKTTETPPKTKE